MTEINFQEQLKNFSKNADLEPNNKIVSPKKRGRPSNSTLKTKKVTTTFSKEELEIIEEAVKLDFHTNKSSFIRLITLQAAQKVINKHKLEE